MLLGKNTANEVRDGCVQTFDAWCCGIQSVSEQLQLCELGGPTFRFTTQEFSMVGGYTENLENHKTVEIGGMGAYSGQYGNSLIVHVHVKLNVYM